MQYKAVIFDLDGTLYNKRGLKLRMLLKDPAHFSFMLCERSVRKALAGKALPDAQQELFTQMASRLGCPLQRVVSWYTDIYMPNMAELIGRCCPPRKDVLALMEKYKEQGAVICLLSDYGFAASKLRALGIAPEAFAVVASAPERGGFKPCPLAFTAIADSLGVPPSQVLVVGDRADTDGAGAAAAGMSFLKV